MFASQQAMATSQVGEIQAPRQVAVQTSAPPGFEDLPTRVETAFDLFYLGERIGSYRAIVEDGRIRFLQPELIVQSLGPRVLPDQVRALLSSPLRTNQNLVCFPGQTDNCGFLPPGTAGVIVAPDVFTVQLFLDRSMLAEKDGEPEQLGPPPSGFSFIQNALVSMSTTTFAGDKIRYGGTFDTFASVGRSAVLAQTVLDDQRGARLEYGYYQYSSNRFVGAAGLFSDYSSLLLNNFQMAGAQFGSNDRLLNNAYGQYSPPIEIVLPRAAVVELSRNGVLLSTRRYEGGLQLIDTSNLPGGSYNVDVVARDGGQIIFQETRTFVKANDIPPPGRTLFNVGVGMRVDEGFVLGAPGSGEGFLPRSTDEFIGTARVSRRVGRATGIGASVLFVGSEVFGETSVSTIFGSTRVTAAAALGADGGYGAYTTGSGILWGVSWNLTARTVKSKTDPVLALTTREYAPFLRSEDSLFGNVQFPLGGGSMNVSGSYTRSAALPDRYSMGLRYSRTVDVGRFGVGLLTAYGSASNFDRRVGVTISFVNRISRRTTASYSAGAEHASGRNVSTRRGFSPIVRGSLSRRDQWGQADLTNEIGASTDSTSDRVYLNSAIYSSLGSADGTLQYENDSSGRNFGSIIFNGQTGFAFGGGKAKLGLRQPGEAMVLVDVKMPDGERSDRYGGYRLRVDNQSYDIVRPGNMVAIGLQSMANYRIGLQPENAPPYEIDLSERKVSIYPGNVVLLTWRAEKSFTVFGQVIDADGKPLADARIQAGSDVGTTDQNGYFIITSGQEANLEVIREDGSVCLVRQVKDVLGDVSRNQPLIKIGSIPCQPRPDAVPSGENKRKAEPSGQANAAGDGDRLARSVTEDAPKAQAISSVVPKFVQDPALLALLEGLPSASARDRDGHLMSDGSVQAARNSFCRLYDTFENRANECG